MNLRTDAYAKKIELLRIRKKLQSCGIRVDENLHQDLISIMTSHHQKILEEFPPAWFFSEALLGGAVQKCQIIICIWFKVAPHDDKMVSLLKTHFIWCI